MRISDWSSDVCSSDLRNSRVTRGRGDENARCAAAAAQHRRVDGLDRRKRLAEPNDDARKAAIADNQVGTEAECHDGNGVIEVAEEIGEKIGRASCRERVCPNV